MNVDVVAVEEVGSERLKALSKEQLLDYFLCMRQNKRTIDRGAGESENSERLKRLRPAIAIKATDDEDLNKEPEAGNAVEDGTTDDHTNSELNRKRSDPPRDRAPQPSYSKTRIPHRTTQVTYSGPTVPMLDRERSDSGYQIGHYDARMNGKGGERSNHKGEQELANASVKSDYAKLERSRDNRMRLSEEQAEPGSSESRNRQGVGSGTNPGGWRPMSTSHKGPSKSSNGYNG